MKKILIVDDSASVRQVAKMTLVKSGYEVVEAIDGLDALNKLDGSRFSLIISDLNMPNLDGFGLLEKVKTISSYRFTPFLMLTTESSQEHLQKGKSIGAKAWMVKPFDATLLIQTVQKLIG